MDARNSKTMMQSRADLLNPLSPSGWDFLLAPAASDAVEAPKAAALPAQGQAAALATPSRNDVDAPRQRPASVTELVKAVVLSELAPAQVLAAPSPAAAVATGSASILPPPNFADDAGFDLSSSEPVALAAPPSAPAVPLQAVLRLAVSATHEGARRHLQALRQRRLGPSSWIKARPKAAAAFASKRRTSRSHFWQKIDPPVVFAGALFAVFLGLMLTLVMRSSEKISDQIASPRPPSVATTTTKSGRPPLAKSFRSGEAAKAVGSGGEGLLRQTPSKLKDSSAVKKKAGSSVSRATSSRRLSPTKASLSPRGATKKGLSAMSLQSQAPRPGKPMKAQAKK